MQAPDGKMRLTDVAGYPKTWLIRIQLVDALRRIERASAELGIAVVMLDVMDCGDPERVLRRKALYESYGFLPLPSNPLRLFLPMKTVRELC